MSEGELAGRADGDAEEVPDQTTLAAEVEVLREENQRLREEYAAARRTQYRRTALTLVGVGALASLAGLLFASSRTILLALGGTGVFVGVLTYYLTPEQFLPASVGRDVYEALAQNESALVGELGLQDDQIYVPTDDGRTAVRLFVPQHASYDVPDAESLDDVFVVTNEEDERGVALHPTGTSLVDEFERALVGEFGDDPATLASQLTDGLVEQLELVGSADPDVDAGAGRVTVGIAESSYGPVDRFDHPIASFLAVGFARGLGTPVTVEVEPGAGDRADYLVTCRWDPDERDEQGTPDT